MGRNPTVHPSVSDPFCSSPLHIAQTLRGGFQSPLAALQNSQWIADHSDRPSKPFCWASNSTKILLKLTKNLCSFKTTLLPNLSFIDAGQGLQTSGYAFKLTKHADRQTDSSAISILEVVFPLRPPSTQKKSREEVSLTICSVEKALLWPSLGFVCLSQLAIGRFLAKKLPPLCSFSPCCSQWLVNDEYHQFSLY